MKWLNSRFEFDFRVREVSTNKILFSLIVVFSQCFDFFDFVNDDAKTRNVFFSNVDVDVDDDDDEIDVFETISKSFKIFSFFDDVEANENK